MTINYRVTASIMAMALLLGVRAFAADPVEKCLQHEYNAAAKYAACQQKAVGKRFGGGDLSKFDQANRKCTVKYAATWLKLQQIGLPPCSGSRFVDNGDGTVTDNLTALQWEKKDNLNGTVNGSDPHDADNLYKLSSTGNLDDGTAVTTFLDALNTPPACFAGQCDWRMPTLMELESIRALASSAPYSCLGLGCIDSTFGDTGSDHSYWSATPSAVSSLLAWGATFNDGTSNYYSKVFLVYARAVRGGL